LINFENSRYNNNAIYMYIYIYLHISDILLII